MHEKLFPEFVRRDPGETLPTTAWPTRWTLSRTSIASSYNRIDGISSQAFADEEVVKETTRDNPLRNGVIREATLRKVADLGLVFQGASATSLLWGASLEVGNVAIQIRFICFKDSGYIGRCKVVKQILDGTSVGVNRLRALIFEDEPFNKGASSGMRSHGRVMNPLYLLSIHGYLLDVYPYVPEKCTLALFCSVGKHKRGQEMDLVSIRKNRSRIQTIMLANYKPGFA